ncbi:MAG: pilus assembly protein [Planctomycetaceae bacterium]|nr:pilus assembly protein [Planctomycetaceae bacterium]MCA9046009.1 pilus assembly protein [Planctomycetaceae bacterium]MCB9949484.1 pilus assembly protein [Planctomycetaceae bacterium]
MKRQPQKCDVAYRPEERSGAVAVEFAIAFPVMLMIIFGCVEMTQLNMLKNSLEHAAYEGARAAAVPGRTADDAIAKAEAELAIVNARDVTVEVTPAVFLDTTTEISVTVSVPLNSNAWVAPRFLKDKVLQRTCTLTRERIKQ